MTADAEKVVAPPKLLKAYADRDLALGLGAGVSQASLLPGWDELVCRVAEALPHFGRPSAQTLLDERYDATIVASFLRTKAGSDEKFANLVRKALYRDFPFRAALGKNNYAEFAAHIRATNATLHAVGTMCGSSTGVGSFVPNPFIRAIVTLNIDALLEMYTRARFEERVLRTVERASASADASKIHSYHVHGYLVRELTRSKRPQRSYESDDRLILTEQQYFDVVANANGFVNYTMLHLLREHRFLFVGLSMRDPNLRRALHLSFRERIREIRAEGADDLEAVKRSTRHWAIMSRRGRELDSATSSLLEVLGVSPIFVSHYSEIPGLLQDLYSTQGNWADVA
jgi:hypothetical protein